ncbi:MAG TPA: PhoH family protein [Candidatus Eisenbacteria bacterium]|nr:PhoH family protein [Candidatus Eisenbacteria bacterium]
MHKAYILDTNVLLHDPGSLRSFQDNTVVVPIYVIEEIDHFKKEASELGRNAREVSRILDGYREQGNLSTGVRLESGGTLCVTLGEDGESLEPRNGRSSLSVDNLLLSLALKMRQQEEGRPVVLVTKDTNLRIKADALGLRAEDYETDRVNPGDLYHGAAELFLDPKDVRRLREGEPVPLPPGSYYPNQYAWVRSDEESSLSALARVSPDQTELRPLRVPSRTIHGLTPRNKEQQFALDALLDPEVSLVTLMGKAGTGKTLLAIAAGLYQVEELGVYGRLLMSRPIFPMGNDLGYLPGEIEEKLNPWMQPIFDNLEFLLERQKGRKVNSVAKLLTDGIIGIEPLTYIRGRSIPGQFLVVDEAQNLTPLEVKTIITRVGEGTKIVLTGDLQQIDNPYVDAWSNGFNYLVQKFRPEPLAAHVELMKGERSVLAERASDIL